MWYGWYTRWTEQRINSYYMIWMVVLWIGKLIYCIGESSRYGSKWNYDDVVIFRLIGSMVVRWWRWWSSSTGRQQQLYHVMIILMMMKITKFNKLRNKNTFFFFYFFCCWLVLLTHYVFFTSNLLLPSCYAYAFAYATFSLYCPYICMFIYYFLRAQHDLRLPPSINLCLFHAQLCLVMLCPALYIISSSSNPIIHLSS